MHFVTTYKTSRFAGGLLTNSYYTERPFANQRDFYEYAHYIYNFDLAFSGSESELLAVICYPANAGDKWQQNKAHVWAPIVNGPRGKRPIYNPLPWNWCLNVAMWPGRGRLQHHAYHGALNIEDVAYNDRGCAVLRWNSGSLDYEHNILGPDGRAWPDWLRMPSGGGVPGECFGSRFPRWVTPVGVTVRNKNRRAQALIFNQGIDFQRKIIGIISATGALLFALYQAIDGDTGHWLSAGLKGVTNDIIGSVCALAQAHKDNNKGKDNAKSNGGQGWATRFGPTGASLEDAFDFLERKRDEDLKYLQKFGTGYDVRGEEYFENANGQEWIKVALEWSQYIGSFGFFDFLNPSQEDLPDMHRLDNYTPGYPNLPIKVEGLPRPQKNPEHRIVIPSLSV